MKNDNYPISVLQACVRSFKGDRLFFFFKKNPTKLLSYFSELCKSFIALEPTAIHSEIL